MAGFRSLATRECTRTTLRYARLMSSLTHTDTAGKASMVDVSAKPAVAREATAQGRILLAPDTLRLIKENALQKGDVLAVARIAGIQAAKQTQLLIPLCHQIPLSKAAVDFALEDRAILISATVKTIAPTGVEMEALTAATIAGLTIYDMCKAVDKEMVLTDVKLLSKTKASA
jgi:cyclic pyranopterin phosphate synthase